MDNQINFKNIPLLVEILFLNNPNKKLFKTKNYVRNSTKYISQNQFSNSNMSNKASVTSFKDIAGSSSDSQKTNPLKALVTKGIEKGKFISKNSDDSEKRNSILSVDQTKKNFERDFNKIKDFRLNIDCLIQGKESTFYTKVASNCDFTYNIRHKIENTFKSRKERSQQQNISTTTYQYIEKITPKASDKDSNKISKEEIFKGSKEELNQKITLNNKNETDIYLVEVESVQRYENNKDSYKSTSTQQQLGEIVKNTGKNVLGSEDLYNGYLELNAGKGNLVPHHSINISANMTDKDNSFFLLNIGIDNKSTLKSPSPENTGPSTVKEGLALDYDKVRSIEEKINSLKKDSVTPLNDKTINFPNDENVNDSIFKETSELFSGAPIKNIENTDCLKGVKKSSIETAVELPFLLEIDETINDYNVVKVEDVFLEKDTGKISIETLVLESNNKDILDPTKEILNKHENLPNVSKDENQTEAKLNDVSNLFKHVDTSIIIDNVKPQSQVFLKDENNKMNERSSPSKESIFKDNVRINPLVNERHSLIKSSKSEEHKLLSLIEETEPDKKYSIKDKSKICDNIPVENKKVESDKLSKSSVLSANKLTMEVPPVTSLTSIKEPHHLTNSFEENVEVSKQTEEEFAILSTPLLMEVKDSKASFETLNKEVTLIVKNNESNKEKNVKDQELRIKDRDNKKRSTSEPNLSLINKESNRGISEKEKISTKNINGIDETYVIEVGGSNFIPLEEINDFQESQLKEEPLKEEKIIPKKDINLTIGNDNDNIDDELLTLKKRCEIKEEIDDTEKSQGLQIKVEPLKEREIILAKDPNLSIGNDNDNIDDELLTLKKRCEIKEEKVSIKPVSYNGSVDVKEQNLSFEEKMKTKDQMKKSSEIEPMFVDGQTNTLLENIKSSQISKNESINSFRAISVSIGKENIPLINISLLSGSGPDMILVSHILNPIKYNSEDVFTQLIMNEKKPTQILSFQENDIKNLKEEKEASREKMDSDKISLKIDNEHLLNGTDTRDSSKVLILQEFPELEIKNENIKTENMYSKVLKSKSTQNENDFLLDKRIDKNDEVSEITQNIDITNEPFFEVKNKVPETVSQNLLDSEYSPTHFNDKMLSNRDSLCPEMLLLEDILNGEENEIDLLKKQISFRSIPSNKSDSIIKKNEILVKSSILNKELTHNTEHDLKKKNEEYFILGSQLISKECEISENLYTKDKSLKSKDVAFKDMCTVTQSQNDSLVVKMEVKKGLKKKKSSFDDLTKSKREKELSFKILDQDPHVIKKVTSKKTFQSNKDYTVVETNLQNVEKEKSEIFQFKMKKESEEKEELSKFSQEIKNSSWSTAANMGSKYVDNISFSKDINNLLSETDFLQENKTDQRATIGSQPARHSSWSTIANMGSKYVKDLIPSHTETQDYFDKKTTERDTIGSQPARHSSWSTAANMGSKYVKDLIPSPTEAQDYLDKKTTERDTIGAMFSGEAFNYDDELQNLVIIQQINKQEILSVKSTVDDKQNLSVKETLKSVENEKLLVDKEGSQDTKPAIKKSNLENMCEKLISWKISNDEEKNSYRALSINTLKTNKPLINVSLLSGVNCKRIVISQLSENKTDLLKKYSEDVIMNIMVDEDGKITIESLQEIDKRVEEDNVINVEGNTENVSHKSENISLISSESTNLTELSHLNKAIYDDKKEEEKSWKENLNMEKEHINKESIKFDNEKNKSQEISCLIEKVPIDYEPYYEVENKEIKKLSEKDNRSYHNFLNDTTAVKLEPLVKNETNINTKNSITKEGANFEQINIKKETSNLQSIQRIEKLSKESNIVSEKPSVTVKRSSQTKLDGKDQNLISSQNQSKDLANFVNEKEYIKHKPNSTDNEIKTNESVKPNKSKDNLENIKLMKTISGSSLVPDNSINDLCNITAQWTEGTKTSNREEQILSSIKKENINKENVQLSKENETLLSSIQQPFLNNTTFLDDTELKNLEISSEQHLECGIYLVSAAIDAAILDDELLIYRKPSKDDNDTINQDILGLNTHLISDTIEEVQIKEFKENKIEIENDYDKGNEKYLLEKSDLMPKDINKTLPSKNVSISDIKEEKEEQESLNRKISENIEKKQSTEIRKLSINESEPTKKDDETKGTIIDRIKNYQETKSSFGNDEIIFGKFEKIKMLQDESITSFQPISLNLFNETIPLININLLSGIGSERFLVSHILSDKIVSPTEFPEKLLMNFTLSDEGTKNTQFKNIEDDNNEKQINDKISREKTSGNKIFSKELLSKEEDFISTVEEQILEHESSVEKSLKSKISEAENQISIDIKVISDNLLYKELVQEIENTGGSILEQSKPMNHVFKGSKNDSLISSKREETSIKDKNIESVQNKPLDISSNKEQILEEPAKMSKENLVSEMKSLENVVQKDFENSIQNKWSRSCVPSINMTSIHVEVLKKMTFSVKSSEKIKNEGISEIETLIPKVNVQNISLKESNETNIILHSLNLERICQSNQNLPLEEAVPTSKINDKMEKRSTQEEITKSNLTKIEFSNQRNTFPTKEIETLIGSEIIVPTNALIVESPNKDVLSGNTKLLTVSENPQNFYLSKDENIKSYRIFPMNMDRKDKPFININIISRMCSECVSTSQVICSEIEGESHSVQLLPNVVSSDEGMNCLKLIGKTDKVSSTEQHQALPEQNENQITIVLGNLTPEMYVSITISHSPRMKDVTKDELKDNIEI